MGTSLIHFVGRPECIRTSWSSSFDCYRIQLLNVLNTTGRGHHTVRRLSLANLSQLTITLARAHPLRTVSTTFCWPVVPIYPSILTSVDCCFFPYTYIYPNRCAPQFIIIIGRDLRCRVYYRAGVCSLASLHPLSISLAQMLIDRSAGVFCPRPASRPPVDEHRCTGVVDLDDGTVETGVL